ncbi:hypothetical protein [Streptomyces roseicoloratus]|uniref:hypothetical protein n=1 Tax=Streptomyces roseicoloratus TaxID=2508722 RepID=UPI001009F157|nr:hypothetical protein [Streptomyces roseicoloratus]
MSTRILLTLLSTLFTISLGVGLTGMILDSATAMRTGILATTTTATGLICTTLRHTARLTDREREDIHNAGYKLGLQHVTLGLLDTPPSGGTVVPIRPALPRQHERQAQ